MTTENQDHTSLQTRSVHAGEKPDPGTGASSPNLVMSSTFLADPAASFSAEGSHGEDDFFYTRWGNPTVAQLESKLASLEETEAAMAFASGMAAITGLFFHCLRPGDHLLLGDVIYAAVSETAGDLLTDLGIEVSRVDTSDLNAVSDALRDNTRLVYIESPCNPILRLTDIAAVADLVHERGARLAVDSTFATPIATQPAKLGADFVIHSLTKYLGGHGDAVGGAVLGPEKDISEIRRKIGIRLGGVISPFNAWLILRGIATLHLRMRAHESSALAVARHLEAHPAITKVTYPGLESHPQHDLACRQMSNFSGVLTFQAKDHARLPVVFAEKLKIIHYAVSLGHHRSLVFYIPTDEILKTSFQLSPEQEANYRAFAGDAIFRLSVGIEDPVDLCADLDQAFQSLNP
ncbi:aminotransferase class I/II-fold pyridoxal phosphate-dependent enzyme [Verrucomicrobiales bacterium BCK34]|nr:aminotransferase class I/II-fold pyridoxal phosphate-dependent enzyme [Verrucomicrobiales bacterium BCK34]